MASGDKTYIADKPTQEEILEAVNGLEASKAKQSTVDELKILVNQLISTPSSPIRHIQRGVVKVDYDPVNVTLSGFSNENKMIVLINGVNSDYESATGNSSVTGHIGVLNSISKLTISQSNTLDRSSAESNVSYQVIEFM